MKRLFGFKNKDKQPVLTQGPILPTLIRIAIPIVIGQLFQAAYSLADTIWVGRLGSDAVAAISLSFPIVFFLISIVGGLTVAGTSLVAQHIGAEDKDGADEIASQTLGLIVIMALVVSGVGIVLSDTLLTLLGASAQVLPMASGYLRILFSGIIFMFTSFTVESILRGAGDTVTPMKLRILSV